VSLSQRRTGLAVPGPAALRSTGPACGHFFPFDQAQCRLGLFACPLVLDDGVPPQPPGSALVGLSACPPSVHDDGAPLQPAIPALVCLPARPFATTTPRSGYLAGP